MVPRNHSVNRVKRFVYPCITDLWRRSPDHLLALVLAFRLHGNP